jgi:hypothetical protein
MKTLFRTLLALLAFSVAALAQTTIALTAYTKAIVSNPSGNPGQYDLKLTGSEVSSISIDGYPFVGNEGIMTFTTGYGVAPADNSIFPLGGTFGVGGEFFVDAPGLVDFMGNFENATWSYYQDPNDRDFYVYLLTATITSTESSQGGTLACATAPNAEMFDTQRAIQSCNLTVTLNW